MKRCPECRRNYTDETLNYCLDDGAALLEGPASGSSDPATIKLRSPESLKGKVATEANTRLYTSDAAGATKKKLPKFGIVAIVLAVLVLITGFAYGIFRFLDRQQPARSNANMQTQRLTGDGKARGAEVSPDGRFLAYIRTEGGDRSIWLKQIKTQSNIQVVKPGELDGFGNLSFSPDGEFLYFNAETRMAEVPTVYRVPTIGGTPTKVISNAGSLEFSPDGQYVSFSRFYFEGSESAIFVAKPDGTSEQKIASLSGDEFFEGTAAWSPDGKMIATFSGADSRVPNPQLAVTIVPVDGSESYELGTARWVKGDDLVWHPTGDSVIVAATENTISQPQLSEIAYPSGEVRRLTNNLNGYYSVSITSDGKSLVTGELVARSAVWISPDLKPENARQVMPATGDTWGLSWTPDNRIVYVSDQTGDAEIWIMDADGGNAKPLTSDRIFKATPVVSPDGRHIVYTSSAYGGQLVRIDINGSNRMVLNTSPEADNPDISPDGKWVLFSAWIEGMHRIMRVPIEGGEAQRLTDYFSIEPRYSRDGTRFACFVANKESQVWNRLAIVPADGGEPINVFQAPSNTNIGRGPIWTPDDKGITVVIAPGEKQNLWLQPVDGGEGKQITDFDVPGIARREYSRDGKRIAIVRAEGVGNAIMITDFR